MSTDMDTHAFTPWHPQVGRPDVLDIRLRALDRCSRLRSLDLTGCSQVRARVPYNRRVLDVQLQSCTICNLALRCECAASLSPVSHARCGMLPFTQAHPRPRMA